MFTPTQAASLKAWVVLALAGLCLSSPAAAAGAVGDTPSCISNIRIDTTQVVDDKTILFIMRDRSVYRNTLTDRCFGLLSDTRGFTYSPTDNNDALCSNLVLIRLNTYGTVCSLGAFVRVK